MDDFWVDFWVDLSFEIPTKKWGAFWIRSSMRLGWLEDEFPFGKAFRPKKPVVGFEKAVIYACDGVCHWHWCPVAK